MGNKGPKKFWGQSLLFPTKEPGLDFHCQTAYYQNSYGSETLTSRYLKVSFTFNGRHILTLKHIEISTVLRFLENYLLKLIFNKIVCYYLEILDIVNVINLNMGYLQFTILEMKWQNQLSNFSICFPSASYYMDKKV